MCVKMATTWLTQVRRVCVCSFLDIVKMCDTKILERLGEVTTLGHHDSQSNSYRPKALLQTGPDCPSLQCSTKVDGLRDWVGPRRFYMPLAVGCQPNSSWGSWGPLNSQVVMTWFFGLRAGREEGEQVVAA